MQPRADILPPIFHTPCDAHDADMRQPLVGCINANGHAVEPTVESITTNEGLGCTRTTTGGSIAIELESLGSSATAVFQ